MSIKLRLALLLGLLLVVFLAALFLLRRLEKQQLEAMLASSQRDSIELLDRWLDLTGQSLRQFAYDYSLWDEMVAFVESPDAEWARVNLDASLPNFNAHAVWVMKPDGSVIYNTQRTGPSPIPPPLTTAEWMTLTANNPFVHFFAESADNQVIELRGSPIQRSGDTTRAGSPLGWLLVGRLWDENHLRTLANLTESETQLSEPDSSQVKPAEDAGIALLRPLNDWQGRTLRMLHLRRSAPELSQMLQSDAFEARIFVVFGLLVIASLGLSLHRWVLQPLERIGESLAQEKLEPIRPVLAERTELSRVAQLIETSFEQKSELRREIEDRRRAEEALRQSEAALRETIDERARLGRDLHDGVIQSIYAAGMGLAAARSLMRNDLGDAEQRIDQVRNALNETIRDLRNFITGLEPEALKHQTFRQALESMVDFLRTIDPIDVGLSLDDELTERLPTTVRTDALQIIREAMSNSLRHGKARSVQISLLRDGGFARLEVADNGSGFDPAHVRSGGHGLTNMAERARSSEADFTLRSTPGKGTRVVVRFPYPNHLPA
jgi:signal transduction histidine kinase